MVNDADRAAIESAAAAIGCRVVDWMAGPESITPCLRYRDPDFGVLAWHPVLSIELVRDEMLASFLKSMFTKVLANARAERMAA